MSIPEWIYLGMGMMVARILLDGTDPRGYAWLSWMQFIFDIVRIVVLWPLVLFVERVEAWLKPVHKE